MCTAGMLTLGCSTSGNCSLPTSTSRYTHPTVRKVLLRGRDEVTDTYYLDAADYTQLWNDLRESISFVKGDKPTPGQGTFGHIAGGYDAGYYGYVFALS